MASDALLVAVDGPVATVTLNRPAVLNAMTPALHTAYCRTLARLDADPGVRAVVVTGAGRGFCAGADLTSGEHFADVVRTAVAGGDDPYDAPLRMVTPTIAALHGPCAGMGTAYALMCDVRWGGESLMIGTTFARLGLVAEWGMAHTLVAVVGQAVASELLLSARYVEAREALAVGLVTRVLPDGDLLHAAQDWAREVAATTSPASHAAIKEQLRRVAAGESREEGFRRSVADMLESLTTADVREAMTAFRAKRPPVFGPYDPSAAPT